MDRGKMGRTILFVTGFHPHTRAKALAYEFQRVGRIVRCDIPALRSANAKPYAFIEFRYDRDAEDAYYEMHGRMIDGRMLSVQWARSTPSSSWRYEASDGNRTSNRVRHQKRGDPEREREERDRRYQIRLDRSAQSEGYRSPSPERFRGAKDSRSRERITTRDGRDRSISPGRDRERFRSRSRSRDQTMNRTETRGRDRGLSRDGRINGGRARSPVPMRDARDDVGRRSSGEREHNARPTGRMSLEEEAMNN